MASNLIRPNFMGLYLIDANIMNTILKFANLKKQNQGWEIK
jgi:uncharacterized protein YjbI with pentapeptide repeats